ncbi:MAG: hypothetical protein II586_07980 [Butyrivibrio sp.]|nr:hypothetical protein [Butyrivibrio sp.]
MEFDLSAITGSVNKYLNSISDTNKLLAQKKSETAFDSNLSGLFEKYLNKAMLDETQKNTAGISGEDAFESVLGNMGVSATNPYIYDKADISPAKNVSAKSEPDKAKRIDTSVPFPKFDLGSMIADNIASHSRFNADVFKTTEHQSHAENAANSMNPFYTNMIRSSIFDMSGSGEDANI